MDALAVELVGTGLATANPYNHLSLNPALCPFLKSNLSKVEHQALTVRWIEAMSGHLRYLEQQRNQNTELASMLTLLELPNLFALLDRSQAAADPTATIARTTSLYGLFQNLGKPLLIKRVAHVRDIALSTFDRWSHERFEASRTSIEQQMALGHLQEALTGAQELLQQVKAEGEQAYAYADCDLAIAIFLLGRVTLKAGSAENSLVLLEEAFSRFESISAKQSIKAAERMASACITEQGDCLLALGRFDEASAAYQESIRRDSQREAFRDVAVAKVQLANIRVSQGRYPEALCEYKEALALFCRFREPASIASLWHNIGRAYSFTGQLAQAEEAYSHSLSIEVGLDSQAGQADSLLELGNLYGFHLQRFEEAVVCYQRASQIYQRIGQYSNEGGSLSSLADTLRKLRRYDEAKDAVSRAFYAKQNCGHEAQVWPTPPGSGKMSPLSSVHPGA